MRIALERKSSAAGALWRDPLFQLCGAALLACVLPIGLAIVLEPLLATDPVTLMSLLGSVVALFIGTWLFRNMMAFPGIRAENYILPTFMMTFGLVFVGMFLLRLQYSRPLLLAGFVLAVGWFQFVYWMLQRYQRPSIAIVPFGDAHRLCRLTDVDWQRMEPNAPTLPEHCTTLAADFGHDLPDEWQKFIVECTLSGVTVLHHRHLMQSLTGRITMEHLSENPSGTLNPQPPYQATKRVLDLIAALIALPAALCIMLVLAVLIRLDSPGPALLRQERIGLRGKPFRMWKFRTMWVSEQPQHPDTALDFAMTRPNDPRVTRLGRTLRRTRLDELPQIFNILAGQMSWIGPRPEAAHLSQWYEEKIPFYRYRHVVRPGVSGWAQVNQGHVTSVEDVMTKLSYDFYYINRFNIWIDALIVIRTIRTVLTGFGSQ
ncbi:sugar transferase [Sphingomonas hengshuiensis]|uniref:Bacterial sugar transferase domain-containing protein n=1 Tax=Sphingomonas hengshuiensis TaxID=1609977 RepID=A0A7U4J9X1_9SPHN|nr:sugar transferase [Sphingomonas hengshuiensis]AJP72832.1 hypothetical protein TS85_15175 [Sphingomonas hengshuiensis]